ncbi:MAG TPA: glycosyltransferase [Bryobacteraceae bacterium]|nr:glycosyltransferase [Bryobacteraceae bacterium]
MTGPATSETPVVTVIIPTRNRAALLRELVESLWKQTLDPRSYEIIVVDNQSGDGTAAMMAEMQKASPCRLIFHVMQENKGPIHSRNTAARMAQAEILAFTDSDCRVSPDWLERGMAPFADPNVAFVSGVVLDKPEQPVRFFTFRNGAVPGEENFSYPACNILFRKQVFWEMGGFDEGEYVRDIGDKPIECADTDLAWRIRKKGYPNVYVNEAVVYHEVTPMTPWVWLKSQSRVVMVPLAVRLHPELREKLCWWGPFFRVEHLLFYIALLGLVLAVLVNPWLALLAAPYVVHGMTIPGTRFSIVRVPRLLFRSAILAARQAVICASLLYGSLRTRTLIL